MNNLTKTINNILKVIDNIKSDADLDEIQFTNSLPEINSAKESAQSLILYNSYLKYKTELSDKCSGLGIKFHSSNPGLIREELEKISSFINQISGEAKDHRLFTSHSSKIISNNITEFFKRDILYDHPFLMVNLQDEAINDTGHIDKLIKLNTNIFRVNCSFGDHHTWKKTSDNLRLLDKNKGNSPQLLFDLSGRKVRIERILKNGINFNDTIIHKGSSLKINTISYESKEFNSLELITNYDGDLSFCTKNDIIRFDDNRITGKITKVNREYIEVLIINTIANKYKLTLGKGINFPDSGLPVTGLTKKDKEDISFIMDYGDILCLSFIQSSEEITEIIDHLSSKYKKLPPVVIKIETCKALDNLKDILLSVLHFPIAAILVARGDLVSECGWEKLAEIQDKIYNMARAAHLPVILATGILEEFNQTGIPTRSEIIDFQLAQKYDCLLINKGEYMYDVLTYIAND